ncbi:MAG: hypothetical protein KF781_10820 [Chitinophagaceae bacterium]|nr:hypothetical protein [Chitinophagaceae bacterium]MCW5906153.1 hypothetical protein [Chitinophagaceae bacterium]
MKNNRLIIFTVALIALTVIVKYICAPVLGLSGFSPIIAIALFAGMSINNKKNAFLLPLIALLASDVIIEVLYRLDLFSFSGFYKGQLINYSLLMLSVLIGWTVKGKSYLSMGIGALAASTLFFLLSNFSVWYSGTMYVKDFNGLMLCYENALPFYRNELISTTLFLPIIIMGYNYIVQGKSKLVIQ